MLSHFGENKNAIEITETDAEEWRASLKKKSYVVAAISRTVRYARRFFRWGKKRGSVQRDRFAELKAGSQTNAAHQVFVARAMGDRVIDAAPDAEWRLLIALSRFGGLRVPSEALALRWSDVD